MVTHGKSAAEGSIHTRGEETKTSWLRTLAVS